MIHVKLVILKLNSKLAHLSLISVETFQNIELGGPRSV